MKLTIIGATGNLGYRTFIAFYLTQKFQINLIVRNKYKKDFSAFQDVSIFEIDDIQNINVVSNILNESDLIINTINIINSKPVIDSILISNNKLKIIIFTGSTGIYSKTHSQIKRINGEKNVLESKLPYTILRPTMIYGHFEDKNISRLIKFISKYPILPLIGRGNCLIQPVYINDIVNAFKKIIDNPEMFINKTYNIGALYPISNIELIKTVERKLNKKIFKVHVPAFIIKLIIKILSVFKFNIISINQVDRFQENKDINMTDFESIFGFKSKSFEQGVTIEIEEMKSLKII
jgi:nucleoside-diphosphate-sugar epimerase